MSILPRWRAPVSQVCRRRFVAPNPAPTELAEPILDHKGNVVAAELIVATARNLATDFGGWCHVAQVGPLLNIQRLNRKAKNALGQVLLSAGWERSPARVNGAEDIYRMPAA